MIDTSLNLSLRVVHITSALIEVIAWCRIGDK